MGSQNMMRATTAFARSTSRRLFHASSVARYELIDGQQIAKTIRQEIKESVEKLKSEHGIVPGLAVVLVGERKDSQAYVGMKKKACKQAGFLSLETTLPVDASQEELVKVIDDYGAD